MEVTALTLEQEQKEKVDPLQVTEKECEHIVKSLASCCPTAFLLDFLQIILKVLDTENKLHVEVVKESFHKHNIKDVIIAMIYYAKIQRESVPSHSRRRLTSLNERILTREELDSLLYCCLQLSRVLIFENQPGEKYGKSANPKLDEQSLRKANLLLADFLFGASVNLASDKELGKCLF